MSHLYPHSMVRPRGYSDSSLGNDDGQRCSRDESFSFPTNVGTGEGFTNFTNGFFPNRGESFRTGGSGYYTNGGGFPVGNSGGFPTMVNFPPENRFDYATRDSGMMGNINLGFPVRKIPMRQWMRALAGLDLIHPYWEDYRMLGEELGFTYDNIQHLGTQPGGPTQNIFHVWSSRPGATVDRLLMALKNINRADVLDAVNEVIRAAIQKPQRQTSADFFTESCGTYHKENLFMESRSTSTSEKRRSVIGNLPANSTSSRGQPMDSSSRKEGKQVPEYPVEHVGLAHSRSWASPPVHRCMHTDQLAQHHHPSTLADSTLLHEESSMHMTRTDSVNIREGREMAHQGKCEKMEILHQKIQLPSDFQSNTDDVCYYLGLLVFALNGLIRAVHRRFHSAYTDPIDWSHVSVSFYLLAYAKECALVLLMGNFIRSIANCSFLEVLLDILLGAILLVQIYENKIVSQEVKEMRHYVSIRQTVNEPDGSQTVTNHQQVSIMRCHVRHLQASIRMKLIVFILVEGLLLVWVIWMMVWNLSVHMPQVIGVAVCSVDLLVTAVVGVVYYRRVDPKLLSGRFSCCNNHIANQCISDECQTDATCCSDRTHHEPTHGYQSDKHGYDCHDPCEKCGPDQQHCDTSWREPGTCHQRTIHKGCEYCSTSNRH